MKFSEVYNNFNTRFFNKISVEQDCIVKYSILKDNILNEYNTLLNLPDNIKKWFVTPFDFKVCKEFSYYKMKYYKIDNLAIQYINNKITLSDMEILLDIIFDFINKRNLNIKKVTNVYDNYYELYNLKVYNRFEQLKKVKIYNNIENKISNITKYSSIFDIVEKYNKLFIKNMKNFVFSENLIIGHGDLCFSNILYDKQTKQMIFIDPKGFKSKEEMWINPYYDLVKLSHSICGNYDFINFNKYEIINNRIKINFNNNGYINLFKKYLLKNGYDYNIIRLLETSLFLSMLPLHLENENKMIAFILNAINIMEEIEN